MTPECKDAGGLRTKEKKKLCGETQVRRRKFTRFPLRWKEDQVNLENCTSLIHGHVSPGHHT